MTITFIITAVLTLVILVGIPGFILVRKYARAKNGHTDTSRMIKKQRARFLKSKRKPNTHRTVNAPKAMS